MWRLFGSIAACGLAKWMFHNRLGEGDSPILLRGLRKIGTVPGGYETSIKPQAATSVPATATSNTL
jgi:hypothetical protein